METIRIHTLEDLDIAAGSLLKQLEGHTKVAFQGEMGSGKTTLIKALCRKLGVTQGMNSPTFALINEYFTKTGASVFHFVLYRIDDVTELYDLGYEDYFYSDSYCFIEWPEKAPELIPEDFVFVHIEVGKDGSRKVSIGDR